MPHDVDLFKEEEQMVRMTFAEHLEDLRRHLIRALLGFVPAMIIGLFLGGPIVRYMREPARDALMEYYREELQAREYEAQRALARGRPVTVVRVPYYIPRDELLRLIQAATISGESATRDRGPKAAQGDAGEAGRSESGVGKNGPGKANEPPRPDSSPAGKADSQAREEEPSDPSDGADGAVEPEQDVAPQEPWYQAVLRQFGITWDQKAAGPVVSERDRLVQERTLTASDLEQRYVRIDLWTPRVALESAATLPDLDSAVISLGPYETFTAFLRASLLAGVVIASPWIFYQIWSFIAAGLYSYEKRVVYRFLPIAVGLFLVGVFFCFFIVLPVILNFLLSFNRWIGIKPQIRLSEWMGFATLLPIMFGLSFQLPIVMLALERVGIFTVDDYRSRRRIAILVLAFLSMMLTPPDPGSMLAMLLPAVGLYELGIWMCRWGQPPARSAARG